MKNTMNRSQLDMQKDIDDLSTAQMDIDSRFTRLENTPAAVDIEKVIDSVLLL